MTDQQQRELVAAILVAGMLACTEDTDMAAVVALWERVAESIGPMLIPEEVTE